MFFRKPLRGENGKIRGIYKQVSWFFEVASAEPAGLAEVTVPGGSEQDKIEHIDHAVQINISTIVLLIQNADSFQIKAA